MTKIFLAIQGNSFPTHPVLLTLSFFATLHVVSVRIGKNCALCLVYGLGRYPKPRAQFFPLRTSLLVNNIYISTSPNLFTRICMAAIRENYGADIGQILGIHRFKSQHQLLKNLQIFSVSKWYLGHHLCLPKSSRRALFQHHLSQDPDP